MAASLLFTVRVGIPGSLTIEVQAAGPVIVGQPARIFPPLNQPLLDAGPMGDSARQPPEPGVGLIGKSWARGWFTPVSNRLIALGGNTDFQLLTFEAPSLDTTDMLWGATGSADGTTDPATLTATLFGTSVYGRSFAAGDYIIWDDPSIVSGMYQYEIDQITAVNGNIFTLKRRGPQGTAGRAQFNTPMVAHVGVNFYQLIDKTFSVLWQGERQVYKFLWDNMIVSAVSATTPGLTAPVVVSTFPVPPTIALPGLAT